MDYKLERRATEATKRLSAFNLHPKSNSSIGDGHHTDLPCTEDDLKLGHGLAFLLDDLFITPGMTPMDQWQAVARALRLHGLTVADATPRSGVPV